tara:strand:+ start:408 stop:590 length:183 start_codon:yes stop_codon:yes gene_type:complete
MYFFAIDFGICELVFEAKIQNVVRKFRFLPNLKHKKDRHSDEGRNDGLFLFFDFVRIFNI